MTLNVYCGWKKHNLEYLGALSVSVICYVQVAVRCVLSTVKRQHMKRSTADVVLSSGGTAEVGRGSVL